MTKVWQNRCIAIVLISLSVYLGNQARDFPARGGVFPLFSFACIALLALTLLITTFFEKTPSQPEEKKVKLNWDNTKPYILFGLVIIQVYVMKSLGYFVSTGLFMILSALMLGTRKIRTIAYTIIIIFPLFYLFFVIGLKVELPRGILF